jgi:hypothetical protein
MNGEKAMKKMEMFYQVREVGGGCLDLFDAIWPHRPLGISVDPILCGKIERCGHTTACKPVLSLAVFPQIAINHLHHDFEMKLHHLAAVSKSRKCELRFHHAERA